MADVSSINQIVITAKDDTGQALTSVASGLGNVGSQAQKLVDRFDPLSAKIRRAQSDLSALSNAVKVGAFAGQEALVDQIYAQVNANIAQMKTLSEAAGGAVVSGMAGGTKAADGLNLATAGVTREFIVLGHEAMVGNFSRIPGSLLVLTERMGGLSALLNPITLGIVAIGGAVIGFAVAVIKGGQEIDKLNASIAATGNFAGTSAGEIRALAQSVSDEGTLTVGTAQAIMESLTATGKFSIDNIVAITKATDNYAAVTGESATKASEALTKMFEDPAKASEKLNEQYHYLSIAQLEQIKNMQDMGEKQDAINVAVNAFNAALPSHADHLGTLARAWDTVTKSISGAIAAVKTWNIGGDTSGSVDAVAHQVAQLQQRIAAPGGDPNGQLASALAMAQQQLATLKQTAQAQSDDNKQQDENIARWKVVTQYSDEYRKQQLQLKLDDMIRLFNPEDVNQAAIQLDAMRKIQTEIDNIGKSKGVSGVESALAAMDKELINSQIVVDNFGATLDGKTTPALQKLADLEASPIWLKFTQAQKDRAISDAEVASANEQLLATMTAGHAVAQSVIDSLNKTIAGLDLQKVKTDAQIDSLEKYGKANLDTASAVLEFQLANDKNLDALNALAIVNPAVAATLLVRADAETAAARAAAAGADAATQEKTALEAMLATAKKVNDEFARTSAEYEKATAKIVEQTAALGLTKEQLDAHKIAVLDDAIALNEQALAFQNAADFVGPLNDKLEKQTQDLIDRRNALQGLSDKQLLVDTNKAWGDVFNTLANDASSFLQDFEKNGSSAFKKLADDLTSQIIGALAKLAAQQFILSITANTSLAGAAQQAFGQSSANNPIMQLLDKGISGGTSGLYSDFALSGAGSALGLSTAPAIGLGEGALAGGLGAGAAGEAVGSLAGGAALTEVGATLGAGLSAVASFIPYVGIAIAAISALGLFNKSPTQVSGQFAISPGTTGFEDNAFTASNFGNLGFSDANTQQFSGEAAQVFNKIVGGALDAFQSRFSPEQSARLASILQNTTFASSEGTFTTQDFLQKYGGQVLQQVVTAAFNVLDPALGSVAANFKGTADEVATFSNSLLGIFDATKQIGNVDFTKNVDAALADATQATADKVLALVTIVSQFGDSITGLGPKIEALDPAQMTAFVDALGGAQTALQTMTFINTNFTTSADKAGAAATLLNADFVGLGLAVPATHQAFLNLLNSFDLATPAGQQLYASVSALAPLFVQVAGTADQAAAALAQQVQSAQQFFNQNFFTAAEQQASKIADDLKQIDAAQTALGVSIPHSVDAFRTMVLGIDQSTDAGKTLYNALIVLAPAIFDLGGAATTAAAQVGQAVQSIVDSTQALLDSRAKATDAATTLINNLESAIQTGTGSFGDKLTQELTAVQAQITRTIANSPTPVSSSNTAFGTVYTTQDPATLAFLNTLDKSRTALADELARFTILSAQYDAGRAEQLVQLEDWDKQQNALFAGNTDALTAVQTIFQQKWDAIVTGVSSGVSGALDQMARLQQGIADYLKGLQVGALSPLTPSQQFNAAQNAFLDELAKAQPSNTDLGSRQAALGDITQLSDAFLKQAQSFDPSNYLNVFDEVTKDLAPLAGTGPNGLPLPTTTSATAAIASALPTDSKLASSADIAINTAATKTLQTTMQQLLTAIANAATKDAQLQTAATLTAANLLVASTPKR